MINTFILCGGRGMRMGGVNKGRLKLCGRDFVEILYDEFIPFGKVYVVGRKEKFPEFPSVDDMISDIGPVGGILTALSMSESEKALIIPCDTPLFSRKIGEYLLEISAGYEIAAFFTEKLTPIPGVYSKSLLDDLMKFVEGGGRSLTSFVVRRKSIFVHPRSWNLIKGVNTPEDYAHLLEIYGCQH